MISWISIVCLVALVVIVSVLPDSLSVAEDAAMNQLVAIFCLIGWVSEAHTRHKSRSRLYAVWTLLIFCGWVAVSRPFIEMHGIEVVVEAISFAVCVLLAAIAGGGKGAGFRAKEGD